MSAPRFPKTDDVFRSHESGEKESSRYRWSRSIARLGKPREGRALLEIGVPVAIMQSAAFQSNWQKRWMIYKYAVGKRLRCLLPKDLRSRWLESTRAAPQQNQNTRAALRPSCNPRPSFGEAICHPWSDNGKKGVRLCAAGRRERPREGGRGAVKTFSSASQREAARQPPRHRAIGQSRVDSQSEPLLG